MNIAHYGIQSANGLYANLMNLLPASFPEVRVSLRRRLIGALVEMNVPAAARAQRDRDLRGPGADPGPDLAVREALAWIGRAQDASRSKDGGVARHFSLLDGWGPSYPETTGYLVPTMFAASDRLGSAEFEQRGRRMLDWLVGIQLANGAFQGGTVDQLPVRPVTFNTGQILLGLAAGAERFGDPYRTAARRAADWLVDTQDPDGAWRSQPSPFTIPGDKVFETHVGWGLVEAARVLDEPRYLESARRNAHWALTHQRPNGWFEHCCLTDPMQPYTHTIGYVVRGLLEVGLAARDEQLMGAAERTALALLETIRADGAIPGRLDAEWREAASWCCLTGNAQIAICWMLLGQRSGSTAMVDAARRATRFVRRTMVTSGPDEVRGGVKGSFPVDGRYGRYQYLNWAAKFLIDACLLEQALAPGADPVPGDVSSARPSASA